MRSEDILSAIGQLDDDLLAAGTPTAVRGGAPRKRIAFAVIAAAVAVLAALALAAGLGVRRPSAPPVVPPEESKSDAGPSRRTETDAQSESESDGSEPTDGDTTGPESDGGSANVTDGHFATDPGPTEPVPAEPEPTEPTPTEPEPTGPAPTEPVKTEESRTDGISSSGNTPSDTESDPVGGSESESGSPSGTSDILDPVAPGYVDESGSGPGTEDPTGSGSETDDPGPEERFMTAEWIAFRLYMKEGEPQKFIPDQQSHISGQGQYSLNDSYQKSEKADLWFSFFIMERTSSGNMSRFYLSTVIGEVREKPLTRGYAAFCLWYYAKYLGVELPVLRECDGFSDVYGNTFFGQTMIAVYRAGIMDSLTDDEFGSERAATAEELTSAIAKVKALQGAD